MLRQALTASFGAMLAGQGANASSYADTLAHVVGPGQKLQGLTRAQGDVTKAQQARSDLAREKGSFEQQFEDEFKQNEAKNVLAGQIAQVNTDQKQQQIDIQRGNQKIAAAALNVNAAAKQATTPEAKEAAKFGRSLHDWRMLGPHGRQAVKDAQAKKDAANKRAAKGPKSPDVITSGAFAGYTKDQVAKLPQSEKNRLISDYNRAAHPGAKGKNGKKPQGPDWQTSAQQGQGASDAVNLKDLANRAKTGKPFVPGHAAQPPLDRHQAAAKIQQSAKIRDPILLTAALDAAYDGHLSRVTVRKLIAAGYKPSRIASALGVPTPANYTPPSRPGRSPGSVVPGVGSTVAQP
jgi:hypothetical protein